MQNFDNNFIQRLKEQDALAFNEFYLKTVDMFFRYIKTHYYVSDENTNDIISTFYVKQRESLKKIKPEQWFSAYVWTIFKNTIKDYFKKMSDIPFTQIESDNKNFGNFEDNIEDNVDLIDLLEQNFKYEQIEKAMQQLDDLSKDIIYLKFIEEKSNKEIADQLLLSQDNVRQKFQIFICLYKKILMRFISSKLLIIYNKFKFQKGNYF